jgi:hypothetical protein
MAPSNIYMAGILSLGPFQNSNPHHSLDPKLPELLAEVRDDSNSGEQFFRSVRRWRNPRVLLRASRQELRPDAF